MDRTRVTCSMICACAPRPPVVQAPGRGLAQAESRPGRKRFRRQGNSKTLPARLLASSLAFTACILGATPAFGQSLHPTAHTQVVYSSSPLEVLVSLSLVRDDLQAPDQAPLVSVFGDGRIVVHLPRDRSRAGTYESFLNEFELAQLLQSLIDKGLASFDTDDTMTRKRAIQARRRASARRAGRPKVFYHTDNTVTVVSLNLIDYKPSLRGADWQGPVRKRVRWVGLDVDLRSFGGIESIRDLAAAVSELVRLSEHVELGSTE